MVKIEGGRKPSLFLMMISGGKKMKIKKNFFIFLLSAILFAAASMTGGAALAGSDDTLVIVRIKNLAFVPAEITIRPGTTVRWVNEDPFSHDVTSGSVVSGRRARQVSKSRHPDGRFHSGTYGQGRSFEQTFDDVGDYPYFCTIHPIMFGTVNVVK